VKLGYPNHPRMDVIEEIDWIGSNGFEFVDLMIEPDRAALECIDPVAVRGALDRHGLDVVGHTGYYVPIGSPMSQLREAAVEILAAHLHMFARINVPAVTVHAHWPPFFFSQDDGVAWQVESLNGILQVAADLGVRIMYEPVTGSWDTPENISRVLDALPELLLHLDIGHCNLHGRSPGAMIRQFSDRLEHVHLHDNNGAADLHLPPGTGNIDWLDTFAALKEIAYAKTITLEIFSPDRDFILLAKHKVAEWWAGTAQPPQPMY